MSDLQTQPPPSGILIRRISAAETLPLRLAVLRFGRPAESAKFPGDDAPTTWHFGALRNGVLQSIASLFTSEWPGAPGVPALQLRGMATAPEARGAGLARALVARCVVQAREQGARLLWCNARTTAAGFYLKLGFETVGPEFDIPEVGPHVLMRLALG
jgi:GNAT superfamily N-acetyltransferase